MNEEHHADIEKLAMLARIQLTQEEKENLPRHIDSILSYLDKLAEVDVEEIEPSAHASPLYNVLREDVPGDVFTEEEALKNAPAQRNNLVIVPKVVE